MKRFIGARNLLFVLLLLAIPAASFAGIAVSITVAPPALPVYVQPPCPVDGYLWTPGYWAWGPAGYYWVPGVWVAPPQVGLLWTPGYWGFLGGAYFWHAGYWGPHVGFYGGINYGFGYPGHGFFGGVWSGGAFRYNTAVVNVNRTVIHNTYVDRSFARNVVATNRASFNGVGGVNARPTPAERTAMSERHFAGTHAGRQFGRTNVAGQPNRMNTMARTNQAVQHQQFNRPTAMARTNQPAQRQQFNRPNAMARTNQPVQHQQFNRPSPAGRTSLQAQHPQPQTHAMARPNAAPQQHPQMQAQRETRGGPHER